MVAFLTLLPYPLLQNSNLTCPTSNRTISARAFVVVTVTHEKTDNYFSDCVGYCSVASVSTEPKVVKTLTRRLLKPGLLLVLY